MAYNINDIADYIIINQTVNDKNNYLSNLKLQKLLYYIQAWSYGINQKPLFDGDFEAWIHGPVNREIYNRFASTKNIYSEIEMNDCINKDVKIDNDDAEFIDWILKNYAKFSGFELEKLSCSEIPWIKTRDMLDPYERCDKVISPDFIQEYYGEKWEKIK